MSIYLHRSSSLYGLPANVHDEGAGRPTRTNPTSAADGGRAHEPRRRGGEDDDEEQGGSRHAAGTAGRAPDEPCRPPWRPQIWY